MSETTEIEQIDKLLADLDKTPDEPEPESVDERPLSPTLTALDESRRPSREVVCATCPNSVWFASKTEVKCYCRVMYLVTWSTVEPNEIKLCDGIAMS